ncbi:HTH-type transcriptional regulator AdhR [Lacticaseibacillus paracasei]|uniref:HTH-type transcriptional regulator AdhR n=1 Tax=Lacticaseibacillus paracasei TaxID=1597 RepID=A0A422M0D4_LACPA|nr:HTH-type transcriptional regulator AdhR [Lacticaseibacillus paracasei]
MSKSYSIGEVATMTKLSIPTIRYYDKEGLIPELKKDASGARCFDDQNLGALEMIECLKTAGMSIKDIKTFMQWNLEGDTTLKKRRDFFDQLHVTVLAQMAAYNEPR